MDEWDLHGFTWLIHGHLQTALHIQVNIQKAFDDGKFRLAFPLILLTIKGLYGTLHFFFANIWKHMDTYYIYILKTWRENLQHCNLCKGIHQKYSTWGFFRFHCNWVENVGASRLTVCARKTLPWPCPYWGQWCRRESFQPPPAQFGQFGHRFRGVSSFLVAMVNAIWHISRTWEPHSILIDHHHHQKFVFLRFVHPCFKKT